MFKKIIVISFFIFFNKISKSADNPKLIVGIVVDQMRNEYITRFWNKYGQDGFKLLVEEGFWCKNNHYNYFPTYTGPGHASIYTGTTPSNHGIVGNEWYDKKKSKKIYCTEDPNVKTIGANNESGKMSPVNLLSSTITDQLKISTQMKSKVIGVSLKDRGSILPAGHFANAAYWFDANSGNFVTSSFYIDTLPKWVQQFNNLGMAEKYIDQTWSTLLPIYEYTESLPDNNPYETVLKGKQIPTFPYPLARLKKNFNNYDLLRYTPFGNSIVTDFTIETLEKEKLGRDSITDFLCVSYSSTDYVGHEFGPQSVELEDTYLRLDRDIEKLMKYLEDSIGFGNYIVFLTSDHGVAENSIYLSDHKYDVGVFESGTLAQDINAYLKSIDTNLTSSPIQFYGNQQLYYSSSFIPTIQTSSILKNWLLNKKGISDVWSKQEVLENASNSKEMRMYRNGFYEQRSGDYFVHLLPGWTEYKTTGATHGSIFNYDTHVPLLFYGKDIPIGSTNRETHITDIAKTLALYLNIIEPDACNGDVIFELFQTK